MSCNYIKDNAETYFSQLHQLISSDKGIKDKYLLLRDLFRRLVDQSVLDAPINVAGLFGKVDYLVKKFQIPSAYARTIHSTRHSLNEIGKKSEEEMSQSFLYDAKTISLFVSYIFLGAAVPPSLANLLPQEFKSARWRAFNENHIRCIVNEWDDDFIFATEEQNGTVLRVCYGEKNTYLSRSGIHDWSYLRKILSEGTTLNLVRIRMEEDICLPELIIYEPDYLINVTTVASCFESYAESPYIHLINKLKPQANTVPIHLGNLSGQYLDNAIHHRNIPYEESWSEYLRSNAIGVLSCGDICSRQGYEEFMNLARQQKENIDKLIGEDLLHIPDIEQFDPKDIILEPTFFSEVLGIQGRLDFLWETKDPDPSKRKTIIIEQKSGKGENVWPPIPGADPEVPFAKEQHWVQLILYRALFIYEFQKYADKLQDVMLLYSRYSKGLISKAYSPELMLRAIRMRNLLAWCEIHYSKDGMPELLSMTSAHLRKKKVSDKFWNLYIKSQLDEVLEPIHSASPLEKAYYLRFLRFVEKEQLLSKIGNKEKEDSGFASTWHSSLEDKKNSGNICDGLTIKSFGYSDDGTVVERVLLARGERLSSSNFRKGDIVILYDYKEGDVPRVCAQMVHRASIVDITEDTIELSLRNSQTSKHIFHKTPNTQWAIEHDMIESSTSALYSGLQSFLSASKARRDLILSRRQPKVDASIERRGEYGTFNTLVERAKQARELFLIIGPPGTGKTSFGLLNQLKEELLEPDTNVLLLSYTNRAVDEICSKLVEDGIDFVRVGSPLTSSPEYHKYLLSERVCKCATGREMMTIFRETRVFCGTTAALNSHIHLFRIKHFDLAIIDESSQILEPHLIGLLSAKSGDRDAITRFVFIGDHKQLPAVVQQSAEDSLVAEPLLRDIGLTDCRLSLFERLLSHFKTAEGYDERFVYMLTRQGRMHPDIAEFPNMAFYGGKLQVVPLPHQVDADPQSPHSQAPAQNSPFSFFHIPFPRVAFISVDRPFLSTSPKTNEVEAELIAKLSMEIYRHHEDTFDADTTLGIIVPYRNQVTTIRNAIERLDRSGKLMGITIDTVERYQGSQRDYIIYGFTVQQRYQLNFLTDHVFEEDGESIDRKLNVAMTRARLHLFMVGNPSILRDDPIFSRLLSFVREKGGVYAGQDIV